ncbi:MAG: hypothetical protein ABIK83_15830 [Candidatus Zixiibacteriota bacterium]
MAWQKFDKFGESFSPKISIRATGHIGFSAGAVNRFQLDKYEFCELYYDGEKDLVGFMPTSEAMHGVTTKLVVREMDCYVVAKAFLDFHGIDYRITKSYHGIQEDETGLIVIDLKQPVIIHDKRKKRRAGMKGGGDDD